MADEHTSPEVATMAARILGMSDALIRGLAYRDPGAIRAVAASALTQAKPKPKKPKASAPANPEA